MSDGIIDATETEQPVEKMETPVVPPEFVDSRNPESPPADLNLDMIFNVPVKLTIEIGQTSISIGELLALTPGAVIELDRSVGEPLDILVNGSLIAHGEIVVLQERFGIRFTDLVSPVDRVEGLNR